MSAAECYEALGQIGNAVDILSSFLHLGMKNIIVIDYLTALRKKME